MLKIENVITTGWEPAIYSMRNPKNSWNRSDSIKPTTWKHNECYIPGEDNNHIYQLVSWEEQQLILGENDLKLATTLANAGTEHGKFLRMINVYFDVVAPFYWLKEMDTYKVGTVCNSCSTMHKITAKEFTKEDFSTEHLFGVNKLLMISVIDRLNEMRDIYINGNNDYEPKDKEVWWQLIQLLPSSYNQKRTYMMNYQTLRAIYHQRRNHKLDEWHTFCDWIETLPYAKELIIGE